MLWQLGQHNQALLDFFFTQIKNGPVPWAKQNVPGCPHCVKLIPHFWAIVLRYESGFWGRYEGHFIDCKNQDTVKANGSCRGGCKRPFACEMKRPPRFSGVFDTREHALSSLPANQRAAYDSDDVAEVNFTTMTQRMAWDYPVIHWIKDTILNNRQQRVSILDAGGHMGTKYISFADLLPVNDLSWSVYDLPAILKSARSYQAAGAVPKAIRFIDDPAEAGEVDLLLASGLLQYLDIPFVDLVDQMAARPRYILLNKVALRDGNSIVTLEKVGPASIPYHIRAKPEFENELSELGYQIRDQWPIPDLSHRVSTHPWLSPSQSKGYMLERVS